MRRLCIVCGTRVDGASYCDKHQRSGGRGSSHLPPTGSGWTWQRIRAQVLERDGRRCQLCGDTASTVDHIIPRADGGSDDLGNLRALCMRCHQLVTRRWRQGR